MLQLTEKQKQQQSQSFGVMAPQYQAEMQGKRAFTDVEASEALKAAPKQFTQQPFDQEKIVDAERFNNGFQKAKDLGFQGSGHDYARQIQSEGYFVENLGTFERGKAKSQVEEQKKQERQDRVKNAWMPGRTESLLNPFSRRLSDEELQARKEQRREDFRGIFSRLKTGIKIPDIMGDRKDVNITEDSVKKTAGNFLFNAADGVLDLVTNLTNLGLNPGDAFVALDVLGSGAEDSLNNRDTAEASIVNSLVGDAKETLSTWKDDPSEIVNFALENPTEIFTLIKPDAIPNAVKKVYKGTKGLIDDTVKFATTQASGLKKSTVDMALKNPDMMQQVMKGTLTLDDQVDDILKVISDKADELSVQGKNYDKIRQLDITIDGKGIIDDVDDFLAGRNIKVSNGRLDFSDSAIGESNMRKAIQDIYDSVSRDKWTPTTILNTRGQIDDIVASVPSGKNKVKSIASAMRDSLDKTAKKQIPGLDKLDEAYSTQAQFLKNLKKDFLKNGNAKDNILSTVYGLTNKSSSGKLNRLEQILPGIGDKIRVLRSFDDILAASGSKSGTYMQALAAGGGALAWGAPGAVVGLVATQPQVVVNALIGFAKSKKRVADVIDKINKGISLKPAELDKVTKLLQDTAARGAAAQELAD